MNAALVLMSSVLMPAADPMPAAAGAPVVVSGQGCSNCAGGPIAYSSHAKCGLLERLKSKSYKAPSTCNTCNTCAPAPAPTPCSTCNTCKSAPRPNLLDTIKAKIAAKKHPPCAPPCGCCGSAPAIVTPVPTTLPPKDMPNPKTVAPDPKPKVGNTSDGINIPLPQGNQSGSYRAPLPIPQRPTVYPASGVKLNGTNSAY